MSKKKSFEHEIAPEFLPEIKEQEHQEYNELEEYYFSNLAPYLNPALLSLDPPPAQFLVWRRRTHSCEEHLRFLVASIHLAERDGGHDLHRRGQQ